MNYLSHQVVARRAFGASASPDVLCGNLLPDLLPTAGDGRIRTIPDTVLPAWSAFAQGARLHLETDRRFHGHPEFKRLCQTAGQMLRDAPFMEPPRRVFFVAHVAVELALDARALIREPYVADDLYTALITCTPARIAQAASAITNTPAPNLATSVSRFIAAGFLRSYATPSGLTQALHRVLQRGGLPGFVSNDLPHLDAVFRALTAQITPVEDELWTPPSHEFSVSPTQTA